jgi:pyridoxine kinase
MPRLPGVWYGTGDIFGSVLLGGLLRGRTLADAAAQAVDFTQKSIARTHAQGTDPRFGVDFEHGLRGLSEESR